MGARQNGTSVRLLAVFIPGGKLDRIGSFLDDPELALDLIGHELIWQYRAAFQKQEWDGVPWKERPCPNVIGAVADLVNGRDAPKPHRLKKGPALVDTGNLMNSPAFNRVGRYSVVHGSNLDYAGPLTDGDVSTVGPVSKSVQKRLWAWMRKIGTKTSVCGQTISNAFGWLLNKGMTDADIVVQHPQRKFIGFTQGTRKRVNKGIVQIVRDL